MTKKRMLVVVGLAAVIALAAWYVFLYEPDSARSYRLANAAAHRVYPGMTRAEAQSALGDALVHKTRSFGDWTENLFFYGTLNLQDTTALAVQTDRVEGQEMVTMVYLVPGYSLCGDHGICSESDLAPTPDN